MTTRELLQAMLRWWYVMVLGAALSLGAVYASTHQPTVFWTQFNVVLLGPTSADFPNSLEDSPFTLYPMAALVVEDLNGGTAPMLTASTDTSMVGQGIVEGVQVRVPNLGSQWRGDFSASYVDVQVAAPTPEGVRAAAEETVDAVAVSLDKMQQEIGIAPRNRVTSMASTSDATVFAVKGNRSRAAAASGSSGAIATGVLVYWLERRSRRRRSPRA